MAEPSSASGLSVVVPTFNRLHRLRMVLDALGEQTASPRDFEVVVVSDGSTDGTDEFMRRFHPDFSLIYHSQHNAGPAAARNLGVQLSGRPIVLFVDDDVVPAHDLLARHLAVHEQEGDQVVVIGPMLTPADHRPSPFVRWEQAMLYKQYDAIGQGRYSPGPRQFYTGNASLSRDLLLAAGGFDERFRRAEDVELAYRLRRLGARFMFERAAVGWHYAERTYQSWIRIAHDYGVNDVTVIRDLCVTDRLRQLRWEFTRRNAVVRRIALFSAGRPGVEALVERLLHLVAHTSDLVGVEPAVQSSLSLLYNSAYYAGLAEALGGHDAFLSFMEQERP